MALSMGVSMELGDVIEFCDYADLEYASDLSDTENEEEYAYTPRAFERTVPRGSSKRTYGVFLESEAVLERRLRSRINEQLELLRAVLPNSCTDEKASILSGACDYIEKLQRQVQELHHELDTESCCDDDLSSCEDDPSLSCTGEVKAVDSKAALESSSASSCGCSQPARLLAREGIDQLTRDSKSFELEVEVVRTDEGLKFHVECDKRPGLLVDIMELLESSGLNLEQANIACEEHLVFDGIGSEVNGNDVADSRHVQACLRSLIAGQRDASSL